MKSAEADAVAVPSVVVNGTMTAMSAPDGAHPAGSASASGAGSYSRSEARDRRGASRGFSSSIWLLEHAQDVGAVAVGGVLIVRASVFLISGIADSLSRSKSL